MNKINENFLNELFKLALTSKSVMNTLVAHLKYEYLPTDEYKQVLKQYLIIYELNKTLPTIGSLSQHFSANNDILKLLYDIQKSDIQDKRDVIMTQLEEYIKKTRFVQLYNKIGTMYNEGKANKAISTLYDQSKSIADFTLMKANYDTVFQDFNMRQVERMKNYEDFKNIKIPFGIHELDYYTNGGIEYGSSALLMARSGRGKSTMMRWIGLSAANMGYKVVHFQLEGTRDEAMTLYDSGWTATSMYDIEKGILPDNRVSATEKALKNIRKKGGEIFVIEANSFDSFNIENCRNTIIELEKNYGKIDLVIFDYLDIIRSTRFSDSSGNDSNNERMKRLHVANKITDIAKNMNVACVTATQANNVDEGDYNDPAWKMTRNNIADAKNIIYPFSYFVTINQTDDEYDNGIARLYCDKLRKEKSGQVVHIAQALKIARFYDASKTLMMFWDHNKCCKINHTQQVTA